MILGSFIVGFLTLFGFAFCILPGLVVAAAQRFGAAEAVVDRNGPGGTTTRWTFAELADAIDEQAAALVASGIEPGDAVALWAPNIWEWTVSAFATLRAGGILVPINTRFKGGEAAFGLQQAVGVGHRGPCGDGCRPQCTALGNAGSANASAAGD